MKPRPLSLLLMVVVGYLAFSGADCRAADPAGKGSLGLWTAAQLAEPKNPAQAKAERRTRQLSEPDMAAPARLTPVEVPPKLPEAWRGIVRRVAMPAGQRRVALTFDLCERTVHTTGYDARLVDALRAGGARATFFAGGKWLRSHSERSLQLLADPHFEIGNHAWTHANMAVASETQRLQQVQWTNAQYELLAEELDRRLVARHLSDKNRPAANLRPLRLFRLPYGRGGQDVARFLNSQGLAVIQWDVVGEGGQGNAQARAQAIAEAVRPGSIVLLHANAVPKDTAEVVRRLLPLLAQKGYTTATVSELLNLGTPEIVDDGYFSIPGDNRIYDQMFQNHGTGERVRVRRK